MISVDDAETNKKFADQEQADFPMLSDPAKTVAQAYGVLSPAPTDPTRRQNARRWTFYIGPDGKILYIEKMVSTGTAGEDLAKKLEELKVKKK
jgi:thioredoxin-dependent peroxiredoxin